MYCICTVKEVFNFKILKCLISYLFKHKMF